MTNELTIIRGFQTVRTSKSGKQTRRDMEDTMLAGSVAERQAACQWLVEQDWATGDMGATIARLNRVFTAKKIQTVVDSINLGLRMMKSDQEQINVANATKRDTLAIIQGLMLSENKGEKSKWLSIFNAVATAEAERESVKAERKAQFEASEQAKLSAPVSGKCAAAEVIAAVAQDTATA